MTAGAAAPRWVLLLQSGDPARLYEAAAMTASAASLDTDVTVVWLSGALDALLAGRLDGGGGGPEPGSAAALFEEARASGSVRALACSAAMARGRYSPESVRERVDDVVGWPTIVSAIRAAEKSFVF